MYPGLRDLVVVGCTIMTLGVPGLAFGQGFGVAKKNATLVRTMPPLVPLSDVRVAVKVGTVAGCNSAVADSLRVKIAAQVFSNRTLADDPTNPDRTIEVNLTECNADGPTRQRDNTLRLKGTLRAAYRTIDNRTKVSLDSANLASEYDRSFADPDASAATGNGFLDKLSNALQQVGADMNRPPSLEQLATMLIEHLARQVSQRVVPTEIGFTVPLPKGRLESASDLGVASRWGAMLEAYEQMSPLKGEDDAYRRYGTGIAIEALAYAETDRGKQRDLIAKASQEYKAALALKSQERPFRDAEERIAGSLAALDQAAAPEVAQNSEQTAGGRSTGGADNEWTNTQVVNLAREGFKENFLIDMIRSAPAPKFDTSPQGLLQLKRGGVPDAVIGAMMERVKSSQKK